MDDFACWELGRWIDDHVIVADLNLSAELIWTDALLARFGAEKADSLV